jgi:adenine phosphoribosyltransferase
MKASDQSLESSLRAVITTIPDFPKPGVMFKDIMPVLRNPKLLKQVIAELSRQCETVGATHIAALESRGFLFGAPVANLLELPFIPIRKPGKLPGKVIEVAYELEYGSGKLQIQSDVIPRAAKVVIIDDLLATGGTAYGAATLIKKAGAQVLGILCVIELSELGGRQQIKEEQVSSIIRY